jgi:hypothetical protein
VKGLDSGELRQLGGQRPHLTLTASLLPPCGEGQGRGFLTSAGDLDWGQPVPAETVRRIACDAALTPILLGPDSEPLAVGRASRVIPAALRRALAARDGGCRFPGCDRPAAWTDGHHLRHLAEGGETSARNLVLLCRPHHRKMHEGGWRLACEPEQTPVAVPP